MNPRLAQKYTGRFCVAGAFRRNVIERVTITSFLEMPRGLFCCIIKIVFPDAISKKHGIRTRQANTPVIVKTV